MKTNSMESLHRSVISKFNETRGRFPFIYYRDVEVEPAILPLVELLNNEWSLTAHSCGGHWEPTPRFQYPYVALRVFACRSAWRRVVRNTWRALEPRLVGKLSITVEDGCKLPESCPNCSCWRFRPKLSEDWDDSLDIFKDWMAFRREIDLLIGKTCSALRAEMERERKRGRSIGRNHGRRQ